MRGIKKGVRRTLRDADIDEFLADQHRYSEGIKKAARKWLAGQRRPN